MTDLVLNEGDLRVVQGDLIALSLEEDSVAASIIRRVKTPTNNYALLVVEDNAVRLIDTDFGNDIRANLSKPALKVKSLIRQQLQRVLNQETRIIANSFEVTQPNPYTINVVLDYTYNGNSFTIEVQ